jgi:hypothetical protein
MAFRLLRSALFLFTALALGAFTFEAARLIADPRPAAPIESSVLERADRLARGAALYDESLAAAPAVMPGLPFATSLLVRVFDAAMWQPRLLALLATLALAALVLTIVKLETQSWTLSVAGLGFLLAGHALLVEPLGVARPEMPMLLLVVLGFTALRLTQGAWGALVGALGLACAWLVDQQAAWFMAAAAFALGRENRRRLVVFATTAGLVTAGSYVGLSKLFGPWFNFAAWDHSMAYLRPSLPGLLHYVGDHLLGKLGISTLAAVLSFAMPTAPWRGKGGLWMCLGVAAVASGLVATQRADAGPADLLPGVVALSMLGPISMQRVTRHLSAWPGSTRFAGRGVVLAAITLQVIVLLACVTPGRLANGPAAAIDRAGAGVVSVR